MYGKLLKGFRAVPISADSVRGCQESIQLSGACMTKTNKLKKRKETRATARANKLEKGIASGLGSCGVAPGVA
jgi:hypothetical protein